MNIPLLAGTVFSLFGICLLMHSLKNYRKALNSRDWPKAKGTLKKVMLWGKRNIDGKMVDAEKLSVEYNYTVKDELYSGSAVSFYTMVYPETMEFANAHPADSVIEVYYDPADPENSVLIPGSKKGNRYSDLILALLSILTGAGVAIAGWLG